MRLDERNPCPHCGNKEALTKKNIEVKPVIPVDLQHDFSKGISPQDTSLDNTEFIDSIFPQTPDFFGYLSELGIKPKKVSQNLPLEPLFPPLEGASLDPASLKVYFQLSIEFQIILDKAPNYQEGALRWNMILPDRLQEYGLTEDAWNKISSLGDSDPLIQQRLSLLMKRVFG